MGSFLFRIWDGYGLLYSAAFLSVPWRADLSTFVSTATGVPVKDVDLLICHVLESGAVNPAHCPLKRVRTDSFGFAEALIEVTDRDPRWRTKVYQI